MVPGTCLGVKQRTSGRRIGKRQEWISKMYAVEQDALYPSRVVTIDDSKYLELLGWDKRFV